MLSVANVLSQSAFIKRRVFRYACLVGLLVTLTAQSPKAQLFGDGSNGNYTISSGFAMTADLNLINLTIKPGAVFYTQGFTVYVDGTLFNQGTITDISSGGTGGNGGGYGNGGTTSTGQPGFNGFSGSSGPAGAGVGGNGGAGGGGGGGAFDSNDNAYATGGRGGLGGNGGKGGGIVKIFARVLENPGLIHANALNGLNAQNGVSGIYNSYTEVFLTKDVAGGGGGGGGGGQGGSGGSVTIVYQTPTLIGTVTANGGLGGTRGAGASGINTLYSAGGSTFEFNGGTGGVFDATGGNGGRGEFGSGSSGGGGHGELGGSGSPGSVSLTQSVICYADNDGDGFGDPSDPSTDVAGSCGSGYSLNNDDCDDSDPTVYPGAPEFPADGIDQNCDGFDACYVDNDIDGYGSNSVKFGITLNCSAPGESNNNFDCDDSNPGRNPGNAETTCNGIDDDCNASTLDEVDADGDGVTACTDCNDGNANIYPGNVETTCDGIDNDCNAGTPDEIDADGDTFSACIDCDDSNANIYPGNVETTCDGIDNDCNAGTPDEIDGDGDGVTACTDCDDADVTIYPGAPEILDDGIDQDCDGVDATCCGLYTTGQTGNADCSVDGKRNLADITRLIDRVYISKADLCCELNGNIDGDFAAKINLADITNLIDHVYISKLETAPCN